VKDYWDVLLLTGNREKIEIVSSLIQNESLGCIDTDEGISFYFIPSKKGKVDKLINSLNKIHSFKYSWYPLTGICNIVLGLILLGFFILLSDTISLIGTLYFFAIRDKFSPYLTL